MASVSNSMTGSDHLIVSCSILVYAQMIGAHYIVAKFNSDMW